MTDLALPLRPGAMRTGRGELAATAVLAVPMALANLLQMAVYATDVIFLAHLGQAVIAAASLAVSVFMVQMWAFSTMTGAIAPLVAADLGHRATLGDPAHDAAGDADIRVTMRMALWLSVACGVAGMTLCGFGAEILRATGQNAALAARAGAFLGVLRWAMIPMIFSNVLRTYVSAMGRPVFATVITAIAILANALGNNALIFGHWGAPRLGMPGSAVANIITAVVTTLAYAVAILADPNLRRPALLQRWWVFDGARLVALLKIGVPLALTVVAEGGLFSASALLMGRISEAQLAGHALALQIAAFAFMLPMGIGQAATIRVGYHFGAGDHAAVGRAGWTAIGFGLACSLVTAVMLLAVPRFVLSAYLDVRAPGNAVVVGYAVRFMAIAAAFQLADGAQTIVSGALRGLQDTRVPMVVAICSYWLGGFTVSVGLGLFTPLQGTGVWIGLALGLMIVAVCLLWRWTRREAWGLVARSHAAVPPLQPGAEMPPAEAGVAG